MARIEFMAGEDFALKLSRLAAGSEEIAKKAIYRGAKIVADKIKENLRGVRNVHGYQKQDLIEAFGVTPISRDREGYINAKVGFDGYGSKPTDSYPRGIPNQLLARAIESGTSFRPKQPFVRPAVSATKKQAINEMNLAIDEEIAKRMK